MDQTVDLEVAAIYTLHLPFLMYCYRPIKAQCLCRRWGELGLDEEISRRITANLMTHPQ